MEWTRGDPRSDAAEAIDAAVDGDGEALDRILAELSVDQLYRLRDDARFLADCCEMASRSRQ